ncbi:MAG: family 10 glycosylhydrolase [Planctomycetes bacterium]|nr:family 10 glycosylhydrolase [Planctomycetota bacterium]
MRRATAIGELRGVWVSDVDSQVMQSRDNMAALAVQLANLHLNALYPVVWSQGETFYPSDVMVRHGAPKISGRYGLGTDDRDPVADWVALGDAYEMDVVPWFEWGLKVPADSPLARKHADWLSRDDSGRSTFDQDGMTTAYLNFVHPAVQQFYEELVVEFVTRYDVPAIQFDDHFSLKNTFGYDDFTLGCYKEETGKHARPAPADADWLAWRAAKLTQFVSRISKAIKTARPGIELSVSPNPYPWSYKNYVQDWPAWVEKGLVDEVVVQVYRDGMPRFEGELRSPVLARLKGKARLAIGVMAGQKPQPVPIEMVAGQTAKVREFGFSGVVYFFQESLVRFTAPGETVDSRIEGIRRILSAPAG